MPVGELSYITLGVTCLDRSIAFYRDGLGLELIRANPDYAFFDLGGARLALYPDLERETGRAPGANRAGHTALSLNLPTAGTVDQLLAQSLAAGGGMLRQAGPAPWGGHRGYIADPDGHIWELVWHPDYAFRTTDATLKE